MHLGISTSRRLVVVCASTAVGLFLPPTPGFDQRETNSTASHTAAD